jgi:hypothetical protein
MDATARPERRRRGILNALENVPNSDLKAFSRAWNRACAVLGAIGFALVLLALYLR